MAIGPGILGPTGVDSALYSSRTPVGATGSYYASATGEYRFVPTNTSSGYTGSPGYTVAIESAPYLGNYGPTGCTGPSGYNTNHQGNLYPIADYESQGVVAKCYSGLGGLTTEELMSDLLANHSSAVCLKLRHCKLDDKAFAEIIDGLSTHLENGTLAQLRTVDVAYNQLSSGSFPHISKLLASPQIEFLDIVGNRASYRSVIQGYFDIHRDGSEDKLIWISPQDVGKRSLSQRSKISHSNYYQKFYGGY